MTWVWGKAGQRLTEDELLHRRRQATARRNQSRTVRHASDRIAYRLWRAGQLQPYLITMNLDAAGLFGPGVDEACGAAEPDVDLWEAGQLYPTWDQLLKLAELVGTTPRRLCERRDILAVSQTSMRFHGYADDERPRVWMFDQDAVRRTVSGTPERMPEG